MDSKLAFYIVKRVLLAVFTVFLVITITFFVMKAIPGGPFLSEKSPSPAVTAQLEAKYGLDKPVLEQYTTYLGDVVQFDFGPSIKNRGRNVTDLILEGFQTSGKLGLIAAAIAIVFGLVMGSIAAVFHNKVIDKVIMVLSTGSVAMPSFVIATILLLVFCAKIPIFPSNGSTAAGLVLPVISLSLYPMAYITRLTRSSMLDVLGQDYIRTVRAKGLPENKVIVDHALRNALIPTTTVIGLQMGSMLGGSVLTESVFSWPGIGRFMIQSIQGRDIPGVMGCIIIFALSFALINLLVDLIYGFIDPRIKAQYK